tara:strand:- start:3444 stop:6587 length:3144 start_codon:yes stop_codon:yes gene_type:complete
MLEDEYTIFDNFDKLDLNPVANEIVGQDAAPANFITNYTPQSISNFSYGRYNETNLKFINSRPTPFAFSEDMNTYVPDMFRFITNKRFYLTKNGTIVHAENVFEASDKRAEIIFNNNAFEQQYFFDIHTTNFMGMFFNNFLIYKNKFNKESNGSFEFFDPYFIKGENGDKFFFLNKKSNFEDPESVFLGGFNRLTFNTTAIYYSKGVGATSPDILLPSDLFVKVAPEFEFDDIVDYLYSLSTDGIGQEIINAPYPLPMEELILVIQRLLYPYRTPPAEIPKHIYLVSDLKKAHPVHTNHQVVIKPHYSTYKEFAEEYPENVKLEWQLPNIYAYYSYVNSSAGSEVKNYYKDIVKLNATPAELTDFDLLDYYEISNNSKNYLNMDEAVGDIEGYLNLLRQKNIIFGEEVHNLTEEVLSIEEITKDFAPYYNKITLPAQESPLMNNLNEDSTSLVSYLMSFIGNYFEGTLASGSVEEKPVHTFAIHNQDNESNNPVKISAATVQIFDAATSVDFATSAGEETIAAQIEKWKIFMPAEENIRFATKNLDLFDYDDQTEILHNKLRQYNAAHSLSFEEFQKGVKCHSEILAYEIVKYGFNEETGRKTKLQSFFVPSIGDKPVTLLDTQIFYGKDYIYEIFTISYVVGMEYRSELGIKNNQFLIGSAYQTEEECIAANLGDPDNPIGEEGIKTNCKEEFENMDKNIAYKPPTYLGGGDFFKLNEQNYLTPANPLHLAKGILIRAPFQNTLSLLNDADTTAEQEKTTLIDDPPLPPEISFHQYKDNAHKVLIALNVNYGQQKLTPIKVFEEDEAIISKYRQNQKDLNIYPRVLYGTDDFKGTHKVYRTTIKPKNWSAFGDADITEVNNVQSSAFEDKIFPNVEYYYFARFVDIHGNVSNPTNVFYLKMVQDGGFPPFMIVKPYSFSEAQNPLVYDKGFKKYLKISLKDDVRKFYNTSDINTIYLGYDKIGTTTSAFKKYKVRITSKKTGKKIDINLNFKKKLSSQFLNEDIRVISKTEMLAVEKIQVEKVKEMIKKDAKEMQSFFPEIEKNSL